MTAQELEVAKRLQPWAMAYIQLMAYVDGGPKFVAAVASFVRAFGLKP